VPDAGPDLPAALRDGVDARALATAHTESLAGRSYRWRVSREYAAGSGAFERRIVERRTVRVAAATRYLGSRSRLVSETGVTVEIPRSETFADGTTVYRRVAGPDDATASYDRWPAAVCAGGEGATLDAAESMVLRFLTVERATVTRAETAVGPGFRVVGEGAAHPLLSGVESYRVTATVTPDGTVRSLEATYVRPDEGPTGARSVAFEYDGVDATTVDPPWWYDEARRATGTAASDGTPPTPTCGGVDCEQFPGGEAVGEGRCVG
jgi:hypothetical protein